MEISEIKNLVENQFKRLAPNDEFIDAVIKPGEDWEGDKILNIIIVYDTKKREKLLGSRQTMALRRELHSRLRKSEEARFPIIGFVVKSEARELSLAS